MRTLTRTAAAAILALAACSAPGGPRPFGAADEAEVVAGVMGMYGAFQQRDLAKVGTFMTSDSTCYDANRSVLLEGRQAVLDHFGAILAEHKPGEAWQSSVDGMTVKGAGGVAVATYRVRTSQGGRHAAAAVTHVFRLEGGRWLASHLHRSWNVKPE
jgi:ketosteroid isomerase-like protein